MKFFLKNKVWLVVVVTILIIVASTLMLARNDKYKLILFLDNKVYVERPDHTYQFYKDRHINMQAVEFNRDGEVIKSEKLDFSYFFDSHDISFEKLNREVIKLNNVYYDKKKNRYFFSNYYYRGGSRTIWKTLEIKKNIFSGKYEVTKEYQNKGQWEENNYPVGISPDGKYLLHNMGFLCDIKTKKNESRNLYRLLGERGWQLFGSACNCNDILIIDYSYENNDDKAGGRKDGNKLELSSYSIQNQSLKSILCVGNVYFGSIEYYSLPIVKSPHYNVFAFLFTYEDKNATRENENALPIFKFSLGLYNPDRENDIQTVELDEKFMYIGGNSAMAWSNSSAVDKLAFSIFHILTKSKNKLVIYDFKEKAVYDKITLPGYVKSLRWSPDDKKIGLLILEEKAKSKRRSYYDQTEGFIYIYDLKTKKLTKLMDCLDCFDFHFVE